MTDQGLASLVMRLFAAAGRQPPGEVDFEVYAQVLAGVDDGEGGAALANLLTLPDLRPTPGLVLEEVRTARRWAAEHRPAVPEDTGGPASPETVREWAARARTRLLGAPKRAAVSIGKVVAKIPAGAHYFEDHDLCGPECPDSPAAAEVEPEQLVPEEPAPAEPASDGGGR